MKWYKTFLLGYFVGAVVCYVMVFFLFDSKIRIGNKALEKGYVEYVVMDSKTGETELIWKDCSLPKGDK